MTGLSGWPSHTPLVATSVAADPHTLPSAAQAVTLSINAGQRLRAGVLALTVRSAGITHLAGNALDGEFLKRLPSGNGASGGNFLARFATCRQRASAPWPIGRLATLTGGGRRIERA